VSRRTAARRASERADAPPRAPSQPVGEQLQLDLYATAPPAPPTDDVKSCLAGAVRPERFASRSAPATAPSPRSLLVDPRDAELARHRWHPRSNGYAGRTVYEPADRRLAYLAPRNP
jgi:hypothetical protein